MEAFEVEVRETKEKGRHVVAARDYDADELVGCFFPFHHALLDSFKKRVCGHCLSWNEEGRFTDCCEECEVVYFCSPTCRLAFFRDSFHHELCPLERKLNTWKADKDAKSLMRLYLKMEHQRQKERTQSQSQSHDQGKEKGKDGASAEQQQQQQQTEWRPWEPSFRFTLRQALEQYRIELSEDWENRIPPGIMSSHPFGIPTFAQILPLQSHIEDWTKEDHRDWHKHKGFLTTVSETLRQKADSLDPTAAGQETTDTPQDILRLISAFESNNFGIWNHKGEVLGRIIYPAASYFNHACDSNCYTERKGPILFVVTNEPIRKGEEMTISYIDTNQPRSARQTFLSQHYHFTCQCNRCQEELVSGAKVKVSYPKSKNNTQKGKAPKKKALWKEKDPDQLPDISDIISSVPIYAPLPSSALAALETIKNAASASKEQPQPQPGQGEALLPKDA